MVGENFEAEFELASIDHVALFTKKGELLKYKKKLRYSKIPNNLKQVINEKIELQQIDEIEQIHIKKKKYYQLAIVQSCTELKKLFNEDGDLINTISFWD
ncbi:hypothetical protein [Mesonia aestuariivivens]|uniref:Uncharacterized protein n=1 Tax=Mesonia aestuariivivens TaxID=2796128 RepID=A0ABS6W3N2_9FLAO|nr:hypothetical protein [Mesonia aestuariivivens]MBW2961709.1 hypothetical protein [Mesonia aestuariivivens]